MLELGAAGAGWCGRHSLAYTAYLVFIKIKCAHAHTCGLQGRTGQGASLTARLNYAVSQNKETEASRMQ